MKKRNLLSFLALLFVGSISFGMVALSDYVATSQPEIKTYAWSLDVQPNYPSNYYDSCAGLTGSALKKELRRFNQPKNLGYDWQIDAADEYYADSTKILCMYTREPILKSDRVSSSSGYWNREHVWPQSLLTAGKTDRHNYWACDKTSNGIRSNYNYGEVQHLEEYRVDSAIGVLTKCYFDGTLFEPCDEAKGEVARTIMYDLVTFSQADTIKSIFDDQSLIMKWHLANKVTPREIYRNNVIYGIQKNRNPFVDHPEYANAIFGDGTIKPVGPTLTMPETANVLVGETVSVKATLTGSNEPISYTSNNNNIAKVNSQGIVTGISQGSATITAKVSGTNLTKNCVVTVEKPAKLENIAIKIASTTLEVGKTSKVSVTPTPSNASYDVTYSVDNPNVLSVNNKTGEIKALKQGTAIVTATDKANPNIKDSLTINVIKVAEVAYYQKVTSNKSDFSGNYLIGYQFLDGNTKKVNIMNSSILDAKNSMAGELDANGNILASYSDHEFSFEKLNNGKYHIKNKAGEAFLSSSTKSGVDYGIPDSSGNDELNISIGQDSSDVTIEFVNNGPVLRYNIGSPRFQFYGSKINNSGLEIYERVNKEITPPDPTPGEGEGGEVTPPITGDGPYIKEYPTSTHANFKKVFTNLDNYEGIFALGAEVNNQVHFLDNTKSDVANNVISKAKSSSNTYHLERALMIKIVKIDGAYRLHHSNDTYFGPKSSGNGIVFENANTNNALNISVSKGFVTVSNNAKTLQYNVSQNRMRFYGSSQQDLCLYQIQYDAFLYNHNFINTVTCDNGITPPSKANWTKAKELYSYLSSADKAILKDASILDETVGQAVERYDYIIRKYGVKEYENFIGRTIQTNENHSQLSNFNSYEIIFISTALLVSATSIGGLVILIKKRRHI